MVMLVTLSEASDHLRRDTTDDDNDLTLKIQAASGAVVNYLKNINYAYEPELDSAGDPIIDSDGNTVYTATVRYEVRAAVLLLLGMFYKDRDGVDATKWQQGFLPNPVTALLYPLRDPAVA